MPPIIPVKCLGFMQFAPWTNCIDKKYSTRSDRDGLSGLLFGILIDFY